jgi:hypothetical protein
MQMVYPMGRLLGVNRVRAALQEMAQVVARLAGVMGERLESAHRA